MTVNLCTSAHCCGWVVYGNVAMAALNSTPCNFVIPFIQPLVQFLPPLLDATVVIRAFQNAFKTAAAACGADLSVWRCTKVTELLDGITLLFGDTVRNLQNTCIITRFCYMLSLKQTELNNYIARAVMNIRQGCSQGGLGGGNNCPSFFQEKQPSSIGGVTSVQGIMYYGKSHYLALYNDVACLIS